MYQNIASQSQNVPQPQISQPQQQEMMYGSVGQQQRMKYKNVLYKLGITELIMGVISCVLCVASLIGGSISGQQYPYFYSPYVLTYSSQGLWCGGFLIASGILGLTAKNNPSYCIYDANMAVAITTSVFMGVLVIMSAFAAIRTTVFVMICHILLALLGFAGMVMAIVHAAYCCAGVCCLGNQYRGPVVYGQQQVSMQSMMQVQLANGQYMMVAYQPVLQPNVQPAQVSPGTPVVAIQTQMATTSAAPNFYPAQVPLGTPVVAAQMPTTTAAVFNPVPATASEDHAKPPDYSTYLHQ